MDNQLERLVGLGQIQRVEINADHSHDLIRIADQHLISAQSLHNTDPTGSYELLYEAARRALTALLANAGYRPTRTGGHHVLSKACGELGTQKLTSMLGRFDLMRKVRNEVAYPMPDQVPFDARIFDEDLDVAVGIVKECRMILGSSG